MKSLIPFIAAASTASGSLPAYADVDYSHFIINNWEKSVKEFSSNEYVTTAFDAQSHDKHKVYVNTSNQVYVYVAKIGGKLKILSNDYRVVKNVVNYINSDENIVKKFVDKPNVVMKKIRGPVNFEIIPVPVVLGTNSEKVTIIPGNPVNIEQVYSLEVQMKSFITVDQSTTCCATGTCDNITLNPNTNGECRKCHW